MNELALIGSGKAELTLEVPEAMSFEDWRAMGHRLCATERVINWWIGDWWNAGHRYGERARLAAEGIFALGFQTLANLGSVCRRFETSRRREVLSFAHHAEVVALPSADADRLLDRAIANEWSRNTLREEVARSRETRLPRWFERGDAIHVDRDTAKEAIFRAISDAASRGEPCPTADALQEASGVGSVSTTVALMHVLEEERRIEVTRYQRSRVVTILSEGTSTAPAPNQTPHWREAAKQTPTPQPEAIARANPGIADAIFAAARRRSQSPQDYLCRLVWLGWEVECEIDSARARRGVGEAA